MSNRPPRQPITAHEALVLEALRTHGTATLAVLQERTGLCATQLNRAQRAMQERGFVTTDFSHTRRVPMQLMVSMAGCRALLHHLRELEAKAVERVPPPTFNTHGTSCKPEGRVYYRNNGNKHIASAGVSC